MDPTVAAFLRSWSFAPWTIVGCVLSIVVYCRGWCNLRRRRRCAVWTWPTGSVRGWHGSHLSGGLFSASIRLRACYSRSCGEHLLLVFVAAAGLPGSAELPLLHGLPGPLLEIWIMPVVRTTAVPALRGVMHPAVAWLLATLALWIWHVPWLYGLALESDFWHYVEHACLLTTAVSLLVAGISARCEPCTWPRIALLPYLFLAGVQASALCRFWRLPTMCCTGVMKSYRGCGVSRR